MCCFTMICRWRLLKCFFFLLIMCVWIWIYPISLVYANRVMCACVRACLHGCFVCMTGPHGRAVFELNGFTLCKYIWKKIKNKTINQEYRWLVKLCYVSPVVFLTSKLPLEMIWFTENVVSCHLVCTAPCPLCVIWIVSIICPITALWDKFTMSCSNYTRLDS